MSRVAEIIAKYGLRDECSVRGIVGPKMDEDCIQAFIDGDPSETGKYLDWMLLQAGGGMERLSRSTEQWDQGYHGEKPVRDTLREYYIEDAVKGYTDDHGNYVAPISKEAAMQQWEEKDQHVYRQYHIYGDEEYILRGFGFYRSWPGSNSLYLHIVQTVARFHRYQQKLKSLGRSLDLNAANYPNLVDLQTALADVTELEIKNHLVYDEVYDDENLSVVCPLNVGASIKFGHHKWCTANESMFKQALIGTGNNQWRDYGKAAAFYYMRFKVSLHPKYDQIALQAPFKGEASAWKYWDTEDVSHTGQEIASQIIAAGGVQVAASFADAITRITKHHKNFPHHRLNLDFVVKA